MELLISYPGGKNRFYPYMVEYFPDDMETFIEPFFGGGSVSLNVANDNRFRKLTRMIGGDLYTEVWAMWNGVKQNPTAVRELAETLFRNSCPLHEKCMSEGISREALVRELGDKFLERTDLTAEQISRVQLYRQTIEEANRFWDWTQTVDKNSLSLEERAARFLVVNKISFSGMGDAGTLSKDQFFNFKTDKLDKVFETSKLLQNIEILNVSFEETMKFAYEKPESTFVFLDPPYYAQGETTPMYGGKGKESTHAGFPHERFAEETLKLPCKWFMTYDDSPFVRRKFNVPGVEIIPFTIPGGYTMAGKTSEDALAGEELFITNIALDEISEEF